MTLQVPESSAVYVLKHKSHKLGFTQAVNGTKQTEGEISLHF